MEFERQKANILAQNIDGFVDFVQRSYNSKYKNISHPDKLFRLKLIVEEFNFNGIANELKRLNMHSWDQRSTGILVERFRTVLGHVGEYIENNLGDLFIFFGRLTTLRSNCNSFTTI